MTAPQRLTEERVRAALQLTNGHRGKAAELLGVNRVTLWRAMRKYGIAPSWTGGREAA